MSGEIAFVFRRNGELCRDDGSPDMLVDFGADDDFARLRRVAVARSFVHGIADDGVFHAFQRADESVQNFAAVNADPNLASDLAALLATAADFVHCLLHFGRGLHGLEAMLRVRFGAAEDREDRVANELVYAAVVAEN